MKITTRNWLTKKLLLHTVVLFAALIACPVITFAQAGFGDNTDVMDLPIDGGITLLVIAGAGYGVKKMLKNKRSIK